MMIPYGRQSVSQSDIDAVVDVLKSDFLAQGDVVPKFEQALCGYTKASHGIAVNSGTSALHIACLSLGLQQGDYLWTSSITFVASANCGRYCGAEIDFIDIDPDSWNIDVAQLKSKLEHARKSHKLPKILVVVHFAGLPADLKEIHQLSSEYGFHIIEDASHALGAEYLQGKVGNCQYSEITVFSFHPVKIITTGEGGMALTNDQKLANTMRLLSNHGITREVEQMPEKPEGPWCYQQIMLGFNYRMSEIHAALGLSQLARVETFLQRRRHIAQAYNAALAVLPLQTPWVCEDRLSSYHLYTIRLNCNNNPDLRNAAYQQLKDKGIGVQIHYIPVSHHHYYQQLGINTESFPEAEKYYAETLTLPCYPGLSDADQQYVVATLTDLLS
ncbi:MAG: UDP-4-amino-4,6-dideoxy-N-acetyl-beta-L-altrosamine transaminase [Gammaproteobacteria bacterium]|nr:UDP-4-amino-4,6-dideoxy-N-acetyl-beta-L-altrosamine transaminase [Gammaproteobacteria bacterium]NNJ91594.1 UDP-4-amino-4,6-dideoxy-N-acetyl-beta-L-altrosamine transaminase [Gammaproteobacteria bacterium]